MHQNSYDLFVKHALPYFQKGANVLEVGPDDPTEPMSLEGLLKQIVTVNYRCCSPENDRPHRVHMVNEYLTAALTDDFDIVFSANVVEHVRKPWLWFKELTRVTKPVGLVISVSPISWPYHEAPVDCWRLYPEAYKALFEEAGLECVLAVTGESPQVEDRWRDEHGDKPVIDCIAIGRKPQ